MPVTEKAGKEIVDLGNEQRCSQCTEGDREENFSRVY